MEALNAQDLTRTLLAARSSDATVCPSEVARALAKAAGTEPAAWLDLMPTVHAAIDQMLIDGDVRLSWKGKPLSTRAGPYRIGRTQRD